jgi:penicillin-binding protein 1A
MMQGVIQHGTGGRADIDRPAAGKTGTSQDYRDAWFIGFTPDLVAGVWMGDDKDRPMAHVEGGSLPAEAWKRFMLAAEDGMPVRPFIDPAEVAPSPAEAARRDFYGALADELDQAANGVGPIDPQGTADADPQP